MINSHLPCSVDARFSTSVAPSTRSNSATASWTYTSCVGAAGQAFFNQVGRSHGADPIFRSPPPSASLPLPAGVVRVFSLSPSSPSLHPGGFADSIPPQCSDGGDGKPIPTTTAGHKSTADGGIGDGESAPFPPLIRWTTT